MEGRTFKNYIDIETSHIVVSVGMLPAVGRIRLSCNSIEIIIVRPSPEARQPMMSYWALHFREALHQHCLRLDHGPAPTATGETEGSRKLFSALGPHRL